MKHRLILPLALALVIPAFLHADPWPAWRGDAAGSGITAETDLPVEWSPEKNVRWRVPLPERGNSTPVIWEDRVFVTQAIDADHFRGLFCFDRADGKLLWKKGVTYDKPERSHKTNPYCSPSATTDGTRVITNYGSAGVHCYDFDGNVLWSRDFGAQDHVWGHSASPVLYGDLCFHYHGPGKDSRLVALDVKSGETVWEFKEPDWKPVNRTDGFKGRDEEGIIGSFSTPILVRAGDRDELVMSFPMEIRSFDPATGRELWRCGGLNPLVYESPVYDDGVVVAMGGYSGNSIGVRMDGKAEGDVTDTHRLWQKIRHYGGIGTGIAQDGKLYSHKSGGTAYCLDMQTGEDLWEAELPGKGSSWGSFVLAGDHVYTLSQAGDTVIFKAAPDPKFQVIGTSDLGEKTNSSIAVSDGELFIRTHEALWCIGAREEDK